MTDQTGPAQGPQAATQGPGDTPGAAAMGDPAAAPTGEAHAAAPPPAGLSAAAARRALLRDAGKLAAALCGALALAAAALLIPGLVVTGSLEVDVLHLVDGIERTALGQRPHLDFMTPVGDLIFAVPALLRTVFDQPIGASLLWSNVIFTALALPGAIWVGATRIGVKPALLLGLYCILLGCQTAWRSYSADLSFAMAYNRWAWALALPLIAMLLTPWRKDLEAARGPGAQLVDGLIFGVAGALLVWLKATYALALAPAWALWALGQPRRVAGAALGVGLIGGLVVLPLAMAGGDPMGAVRGIAAYAADLQAVAVSDLRPQPGVSPVQLIAAPMPLLGTVGCLISALLLAGAGLRRMAALWALVFAATAVMAWQNFGNELLSLAAFAAAMPAAAAALRAADPARRLLAWPADAAIRGFALMIALFCLQQAVFMQRTLFSGWRGADGAMVFPLADQGGPDMGFPDSWMGVRGGVILRPRADRPWDEAELGPRRDALTDLTGARELQGRTLPDCAMTDGWPIAFAELRDALPEGPGRADLQVAVADVIGAHWMVLGTAPVDGAAIWRYGPAEAELAAADLLAVPVCPFWRSVRNMVIDDVQRRGIPLTPVARTELWSVFEIGEIPAAPAQ